MYLPFEWEHLNYAKAEITVPLSAFQASFPLQEKEISFKIHNDLTCLTWDQFISDENIISKLKQDFNWDLVEMEAFAILSIARNYWILDKCIVIKWISDWANNEAIDAHMSNLEIAMKNSIVVLNEILKKN